MWEGGAPLNLQVNFIQKKSGLFSASCMILEMGVLSDPRAKTKHKFHLRAKSKNKNKMSFNCQILDQKLPKPNQTTRIKNVFF